MFFHCFITLFTSFLTPQHISQLVVSRNIPHLISFSVFMKLLLNIFCLCFYRSSRSEVFLVKGVLKICSKFTGEHPCWSLISIKLLCNFIEITLRHGCSPINLLPIFRTPFTNKTSVWLLLLRGSSHITHVDQSPFSHLYLTLDYYFFIHLANNNTTYP